MKTHFGEFNTSAAVRCGLVLLISLASHCLVGQDRTEYEASNKEEERQIAAKRLSQVLAESKSQNTGIKELRNDISLRLSSLLTDYDDVYLKVLFSNQSRLDFEIDSVKFIYHDIPNGERQKWVKEVAPIVENSVKEITALDEIIVGYCIPIFHLSKKGELVVKFVEKGGSRSISLRVPFQKIEDSKKF
jgi:hypothetical protein